MIEIGDKYRVGESVFIDHDISEDETVIDEVVGKHSDNSGGKITMFFDVRRYIQEEGKTIRHYERVRESQIENELERGSLEEL